MSEETTAGRGAMAGQVERPVRAQPRAMEPALLTGRRGANALRRAGYEESAPRCDNCKHYRRAHLKLFNSLPVSFPNRCVLHLVRVKPMGCCDVWAGKNGDVLEP